MRILRSLLLLAFAIVIFFTSSFANAQPPSPSGSAVAASANLKKVGDTYFDEAKFAEAYDYYEKAYAAYPDPALLYNQGRALESMGEYPDAVAKLEYFRQEAPALAAKVQVDALLAQLKGHLTTLTVTTNVDSAELLVRGKTLGKIEDRQRIISTRSGSADIELRAEGYESVKRVVELPANDKITVQLDLLPKIKVAVLSIAATPHGADVTIDNRPFGPAPVDARVTPGAHTLVFRREGYDDRTVSLTVAASEHREVTVDLTPHRGLLSRWYFWAGVGVILAGGAVTAALLIEKPAEKGSFTPNQARAPLSISF